MKFWDLETFELIGSTRHEVCKLAEAFFYSFKRINYTTTSKTASYQLKFCCNTCKSVLYHYDLSLNLLGKPCLTLFGLQVFHHIVVDGSKCKMISLVVS